MMSKGAPNSKCKITYYIYLCDAGEVVVVLLDFLSICFPFVRVVTQYFEAVGFLDVVVRGLVPECGQTQDLD